MTRDRTDEVHYYYRWCSRARAVHGDGPGLVSKRSGEVTCPECLDWVTKGRDGHRVTLETP